MDDFRRVLTDGHLPAQEQEAYVWLLNSLLGGSACIRNSTRMDAGRRTV